MTRPDSIRAKSLRTHVDEGRITQNNRGYHAFVKYLEYGDEFGKPMTIQRLMIAFNRSRPTITKWIRQYCDDREIAYPEHLADLMVK
jgi:hypothetical protein